MTCKVVLSAGGTGGHMFPALALAQALRAKRAEILLITDNRGEVYAQRYPDIAYRIISSATVKAGLIAKVKMVAALSLGIGQSLVMFLKDRPDVVVGFGGYPSFPSLLAAQILRIPTVLHEQNAVLGKANKMLAGAATKIALSLPSLNSLPEAWRKKAVVTGNPVRAEFSRLASYIEPDTQGAFNLLVLGGSQGAKVFSQLLPEAVAILSEASKARLHIVQQCKQDDIAQVEAAYEAMGVSAQLESFIEDVPRYMERAHLVVSRSGASTVAEIALSGRPAIFIPYPHHADQQQKANAAVLSSQGAAILLEEKGLSPNVLAKELENLLQHPAQLALMADKALKLASEEADLRLAKVILAV